MARMGGSRGIQEEYKSKSHLVTAPPTSWWCRSESWKEMEYVDTCCRALVVTFPCQTQHSFLYVCRFDHWKDIDQLMGDLRCT